MIDAVSIVLFDCTQFISIKIQDNIDTLNDLIERYKELSFKIVNESEIKPQKLDYLKNHLQDYTVELKHDQFLGIFDNWKDKSKVPNEIIRFADITKDIVNTLSVESLKIIFVDYASEKRELDHLIQAECTVNNLIDILFYQSSSCFEAWGNVMIVTVKK